jgi:hypothetical protein
MACVVRSTVPSERMELIWDSFEYTWSTEVDFDFRRRGTERI